MSRYASQQTDDKQLYDTVGSNIPEGQVQDDSYVTSRKEPIPVESDNAVVEDPVQTSLADTDQQLEQDEKEAIDKSNIIDQRTRGSKPRGSYKEPGDEPMGLTE
ncbi:uncharacterized protein TRIVIDRAFT_59511 [Trichoderma virens Gv29-8]|uniref:Histone chaperone domain-containing protein n=1 Tax=Hypocrea virens (strain Gv29-8 / FGSC 10586) TaxID=413071 RepID=G9MWX9_HYPVG|nr:uncharacterized protein TRIVIDRAFT_59511 [Trichoderma virens Gv29-8]EHK21111.1 hypothetical protein TRIVIDRAFT_59511 [Trichoderma virens Gv29-8]UKZ49184.1 hypothetical protein TrVGV298_003427 [Trichoderma virens]UKZ75712.1 hypothetical protein TrVFT333_003404 [Trichoderma virens FT-333]